MKKILLLLLLAPLMVVAQKKEVVYKKLANSTCECMGKKVEVTNTALGLCLFEAMGQLSEKEKKNINYDANKKVEAIQGVAENVGVEMALICPDVFIKLKGDEEADAEEAEEVVEESAVAIGTLESITPNEFNIISLIDENKVQKEFVWLWSFEGDSLLIKNKIVKGDKLEIQYREQEFYNAKTKSYKVYNEITGIKLL